MWSEKQRGTACERYEAALEEYLEGAMPSAELRVHLERCTGCRAAVESARLAGELLREAMEPAAAPQGAFVTRVMAHIRAAETEKAGASDLWGVLEVLARRMALTAAMALVLIALYVGFFEPQRDLAANSSQTEVSDSFPALTGQPATANDQFLAQAEVGRGR